MMRPTVFRAFVLPAFLLTLPTSGFALPQLPGAPGGGDQNLVRVELLADVAAVRPGEPFTVGVRLTIEPGWHVYWLNPGDAGSPTRVELSLPEGFTAGDVQYPVPTRFGQPGELVGYGYTDELLLTAQVTPPADLAPDAKTRVAAKVRWLSCADVCIPGRAEVALTLPTSAGGDATPANAELFATWAARMPVDEASAPAVEKAEWSSEVDAGGAAGTFTLGVTWKGEVKDVELIPGVADDALEVKGVSARTENGETRATLETRVSPGEAIEADVLPALLVFTDGDGRRWGVKTEVPLSALRAEGKGNGK